MQVQRYSQFFHHVTHSAAVNLLGQHIHKQYSRFASLAFAYASTVLEVEFDQPPHPN